MSRHPSATAAENRILMLIGSGRARSRRELAESLGLSPSTISQHVQALITRELVSEGPAGASSGGRRPRELRLIGGTGYIGAIDLGGGHARLGIVRRGGGVVGTGELPVDLRSGAEAVLADVGRALRTLFDSLGLDGSLAGAGIALPGPVDVRNRTVESPSRMPGWTDRDLGALLEQTLDVPAVVENDANAMGLGEHFARSPRARHSVTVKAGTAIGSGVVVDGQVYRGAGGAAGDITHTRVAAAAETPCSCGNLGCLETVASGAGLVRLLREKGYDASGTADVLRLVRDADPIATTLTRTAGRHLGEVLCAVVNFFNPGAVYLGGALSTLEPYVSAIRSQIYEGAHPLMTRDLVIEPSVLGADANIVGVARLVEEALLRDTVA
ncbi:ROK family transcriptional regulator [Microbacterium marinilacus]|uniref:ROK family protein n=1 Tax=Microbacterium marinilacus TaxID=415209 RepID=A0ABP7BT18_9MICO|nr:ROK family transcriptional regulator [Microbacterium marinilacus]MBY0689123.1 ROK family transcriptional regulator [Microbacterium marinilacus]